MVSIWQYGEFMMNFIRRIRWMNVVLWFRMNDKIQRLKTLLMGNKESAVDEPLEDAYLDVSNYGIMATIVKNGKWGK